MKKRVIFISDLHVGSSVAVSPSRFLLEDGQTVNLSSFQERIMFYWNKFWDYARRDCEDFVVIINGDSIDGFHHDTTQVLSNSPMVQANNCIKLLEESLPKNSRLFFTKGTASHVGKGGAFDGLVAKHFNAPCEYVLNLSISGVTFNVAHHTARKIENEVLEQHRQGNFPDYVIRGHYHVPAHSNQIYVEGEKIHRTFGFVTPAWQGLTEYGHRVTRNPHSIVGGIVVEISENGALTLPFEETMFAVSNNRIFEVK